MYLVKDKKTLEANRLAKTYESPQNSAFIEPGKLYPAWRGLLDDNRRTEFTDSAARHTVLPVNAVTHSGQYPKIDGTSIQFNETTADALTVAHHSDWDHGASDDFTYEFFVKFDSISTSDSIFARRNNGSDSTFYARIESGKMNWYNSTDHLSGSTSDFAINIWYHVAFVRESGTLKCYKDGTLLYSFADTYNYSSNTNSDSHLVIGARWTGSIDQHYNGMIDEIRVCPSVAIYSGNFTPPTALTTTGGTYASATNVRAVATGDGYCALLIHSDNGNQGAYGTEQADGRQYYYTDIKGSKPINDPRIGTHFGSQRHTFKSLQLLDDETAAHGYNVYTVDGREWMRASAGTQDWHVRNTSAGVTLELTAASSVAKPEYIEIVAYANMLNFTTAGNHSGGNSFERHDVYVDGSLVFDDPNSAPIGVSSPLLGRFLTGGSTRNAISSGVTLGLHTFKLQVAPPWTGNGYVYLHAVELAAQDQTSTATKSEVQIPAQNVVSYGKKFSVSAAAHHYDPFNGFTNSTHLHSAFVDTATSIGLSNAPGASAAWAISGSNNIRPYNGGRIVKWIDSSGEIKTSVNMVPVNAQCMEQKAAAEITTPSATNVILPSFSDDQIDPEYSEVSKEFHIREFGNGAANAGDGGNYKDLSTKPYADSGNDTTYVMDDAMTMMTGSAYFPADKLYIDWDVSDFWYFSFIGTGFTVRSASTGAHNGTVVNNLPYGAHFVKMNMNGSAPWYCTLTVDGVTLGSSFPAASMNLGWLGYTQPKMPPIPENAVVIGDYMLMADYVQQTGNGFTNISKGVRCQAPSRDLHCFTASNHGFILSMADPAAGGHYLASDATSSGATDNKYSIPCFGTTYTVQGHSSSDKNDLWINDVDVATTGTTGNGHEDIVYPNAAVTLGMNKFAVHGLGTSYAPYISSKGLMIRTPTHTSSHYQAFESPWLYELVGGDRNMEQTNLVVTPDGKTWDEVTRDTSYIGNCVLATTSDTSYGDSADCIFEDRRGDLGASLEPISKDFAIAYDGDVCLRTGQYLIHTTTVNASSGQATGQGRIDVNAEPIKASHGGSSGYTHGHTVVAKDLKRGDWVQIKGAWRADNQVSQYWIERIS